MAVQTIDLVLRELREELARINHLIRMLESMAQGKNRRGRPPKFLTALRDGRGATKRRKRRG